jgi:hypothetical protein
VTAFGGQVVDNLTMLVDRAVQVEYRSGTLR